jgi:hypothetical protein
MAVEAAMTAGVMEVATTPGAMGELVTTLVGMGVAALLVTIPEATALRGEEDLEAGTHHLALDPMTGPVAVKVSESGRGRSWMATMTTSMVTASVGVGAAVL